PERLSGLDLEIDSVDGPNGADLPFEHGALEQWEVLLQAGDFENVRGTVVSYAGGDRFGARVDVLGGQIAAGDLPGPVAGGLVSLDAVFDEFGFDLAADIDGDRTAWGEWASWSQIRQWRRFALERDEALGSCRGEIRNRAQKRSEERRVGRERRGGGGAGR